MVILQLQRMFYGRYPSLSVLYACLSVLLFFWDAKHGLLLTDLPARYSGQVFCSIRFVI